MSTGQHREEPSIRAEISVPSVALDRRHRSFPHTSRTSLSCLCRSSNHCVRCLPVCLIVFLQVGRKRNLGGQTSCPFFETAQRNQSMKTREGKFWFSSPNPAEERKQSNWSKLRSMGNGCKKLPWAYTLFKDFNWSHAGWPASLTWVSSTTCVVWEGSRNVRIRWVSFKTETRRFYNFCKKFICREN